VQLAVNGDRLKARTRRWRASVVGVALAVLTGLLGSTVVRAEDPPERGGAPRYAFLVGSSEYLYGRQIGLSDLNFPDDDAVQFGAALLGLGWTAEHIDVLVQGDGSGPGARDAIRRRIVGPPTRASIAERWAKFMARVREDAERTGKRADAVVLLLSGHGVEFQGQPKGGLKVENTYYVPADASSMQAESLVDVQVMLEELQGLPTNRRWFVYDACRKAEATAARGYAASNTMLQRLRVPEGTWLLLSCKAAEESFESKALGHGVFLHHLLEGMRSDQAVNAEGEVTITSLADYAARATERWVAQHLGGSGQRPVLKSEGESWVLARRPRPAGSPPPLPEPAWARDLASPAQRAEARRLGRPVAIDEPVTGLRFLLIPGGTFRMGSPVGRGAEDEHPQAQVTLTPFYLSIHEVSNAQFRAFRPEHDSGGYTVEIGASKGRFYSANGESQPAAMVSHREATAFTRWLSGQGKLRGFRLPSEAQWEYACRAGSTGEYFWGDGVEDGPRYANAMEPVSHETFGWHPNGWPTDDGYRLTAPVGSLRPSPWGLYDIHGNVFEWCSDWYGPYEGAARNDPEGPTDGERKVLRGGCWGCSHHECRSASRTHNTPDVNDLNAVGFRVALPISAL
jgi:formylglycine-generating enzyme required for sulfatase activity